MIVWGRLNEEAEDAAWVASCVSVDEVHFCFCGLAVDRVFAGCVEVPGLVSLGSATEEELLCSLPAYEINFLIGIVALTEREGRHVDGVVRRTRQRIAETGPRVLQMPVDMVGVMKGRPVVAATAIGFV